VPGRIGLIGLLKGRIVRTATEARQGEIILGKYGRWIWIGSFAALLILLLLLAWP
jgi:hypothetical protein